jgi:hypothetical protein
MEGTVTWKKGEEDGDTEPQSRNSKENGKGERQKGRGRRWGNPASWEGKGRRTEKRLKSKKQEECGE